MSAIIPAVKGEECEALLALAQRLRLPEALDIYLGNHGLHQGLSNGWLATVWITCILTAGDPRKSTTQEWVDQHHDRLQAQLPQPIRPLEFSSGRLGIMLRRLSELASWEQLEARLWKNSLALLPHQPTVVRLDNISFANGTQREPFSRRGNFSLQHDGERALQILTAVCEPEGCPIACAICPATLSEEPLYLPFIRRVRALMDRPGVLFVSHAPLASPITRGTLAAAGDHYLTPLPLADALEAPFPQPIPDAEHFFTRTQQAALSNTPVRWQEYLRLSYSAPLAQQQAEALEQSLTTAETTLRALTPPPAKGKRLFRDAVALQDAIAAVLAREGVADFLRVSWVKQEQRCLRYIGRGRGSLRRPVREVIHSRCVITGVLREEEALARQQQRFGWRLHAASLPAEALPPEANASGSYLRQDIERLAGSFSVSGFLHVRRTDQVLGLIRLLMLGLRLRALRDSIRSNAW